MAANGAGPSPTISMMRKPCKAGAMPSPCAVTAARP
ncbi:Uncharacterised protein [Bordetella pertussis]|nr:Uncharacterised protein [Bordetella pertussis]